MLKSYATGMALKRLTLPTELAFTLMTHFFPMAFLPCGSCLSLKVALYYKKCNLLKMTLRHLNLTPDLPTSVDAMAIVTGI